MSIPCSGPAKEVWRRWGKKNSNVKAGMDDMGHPLVYCYCPPVGQNYVRCPPKRILELVGDRPLGN